MSLQEAGPSALAGVERAEYGNANRPPMLQPDPGRFNPRCELHGHRLVDRLPRNCPLSESNALGAVERLLNNAWAMIGTKQDGGSAAKCRAETCLRCIGARSNHPTVVRLRAEARPADLDPAAEDDPGDPPTRPVEAPAGTTLPAPAVDIPRKVRRAIRRAS